MFTEYYFYLISYKCDDSDPDTPFYFRIDRITDITMHREKFTLTKEQNVDSYLRAEPISYWLCPYFALYTLLDSQFEQHLIFCSFIM